MRLSELFERFRAGSPDGRDYDLLDLQETAREIRKRGRTGRRFLMEALRGKDGLRVSAALFSLSAGRQPAIGAEAVIAFLTDARPVVVAQAVDSLRQFKFVKVVDRIEPLAEADDPHVVGAALRFLARVQGIRALPLLRRALRHPHHIVRENACDEFAALKAVGAIADIEPLIQDVHSDVRLAARTAVEDLKTLLAHG